MKKSISALFIIVLSIHFLQAQAGYKEGQVKDKSGKPMTGVMVIDATSGKAVVTDSKGRYKVYVPDTLAAEMNVKDEEAAEALEMRKDGVKKEYIPMAPAAAERHDATKYVEGREDAIISGETFSTYSTPITYSTYSGASATYYAVEGSTGFSAYNADGVGRLWTMDGFTYTTKTPEKILVRNDQNEVIGYQSGLLTAGEINDFTKWSIWTDYLKNSKDLQEVWGITPSERFTVQVTTKNMQPLYGATVKLYAGDEIVWSAKTDNTGKAELWNNYFTANKNESKVFKAVVSFQGKNYDLKSLKPFENGINYLKINTKCQGAPQMDVAFLIDATGSMQDEIDYIRGELMSMMTRLHDTLPDNVSLRFGNLFYRDEGDEYITLNSDFTDNFQEAVDKIALLSAGGGGDTPEALAEGLEEALTALSWRADAQKVMFIVLDAPPHEEKAAQLRASIEKAAAMGVRLVPVGCSGIDPSAENILRNMALGTNGTYIFLTNDSGIGGEHLKPSTDQYAVELLDNLLTRISFQYASFPECDPEETQPDTALVVADTILQNIWEQQDSSRLNQQNLSLKIYPNPTEGYVKVELSQAVKTLYLTDLSGKTLAVYNTDENLIQELDLSMYPNGMYFVRVAINEHLWLSGKIVVAH